MDYGALGFRLFLLLLLGCTVKGQNSPAPYPFDCRRSNVGCENGFLCDRSTGKCLCNDTFEGDNCGFNKATADACEDAQNNCENDAKCHLTGDSPSCFCNSKTYGTKCENPRVKMWCTDQNMFINIYPHGDDKFNGKLIVSNPDNNSNRDKEECQLKNVSGVNLQDYSYVKTLQNETPTLQGYYIVLPHANATGSCTPAIKMADNDSTDYIQNVVLEYSSTIISSLDQVVAFNCSISTSTSPDFTSENSMSVVIYNGDYQKVNASDTIEPILFEIREPGGGVITNSVSLGDPLDLVFTLQTGDGSSNDSFVQFKVTQCSATTIRSDGPSIEFLKNDCPAEDSDLLYRENIRQEDNNKKVTIPLNAFRFVGSEDQVTFNCHVKLCKQADLDSNPIACTAVCSKDSENEAVEGTQEVEGNVTEVNLSEPQSRRKRADDDSEKRVTQTVQVSALPSSAHAETSGEQPREECVSHNELIIIIAIFAVILVLMLVAIVALTARLLTPRVKTVDYSEISADTHARYTLPRLSVATGM